MTRRERRELAKTLAAEHGVEFAIAFKAVQLGVEWRCTALAAGTADPAQAFLAATQAFASRPRVPVFGKLTDQQRARLAAAGGR